MATHDNMSALQRVLDRTSDATWLLQEHGYRPERESSIESRFAVSNGFLGVRAARAVSRGAMWVSWSHTLSWASWPRTYVAGLFDTPNIQPPVPALVPGPDWLRIRLALDGKTLLLRSGELLEHRRTLDMRRGLLLIDWRHRDSAGRIAHVRSIRFVSLADRAIGVQLLELSVDKEAEISLEALMEDAGSGLEVVRMEPHLAIWRTAESGKSLAVASTAELHLEGTNLLPDFQNHCKRAGCGSLCRGKPYGFGVLRHSRGATTASKTCGRRCDRRSIAPSAPAGERSSRRTKAPGRSAGCAAIFASTATRKRRRRCDSPPTT